MDKQLPPLGDDDIYRLADILLMHHGLEAATVAEKRAHLRFGEGDMDGYRAWMRIVLVVDNLLSMIPPSGASVH